MLANDPTIDLSEVARRFAPDTADGLINADLARLLLRNIITGYAEVLRIRPFMDGGRGTTTEHLAHPIPQWFWYSVVQAANNSGIDSDGNNAYTVVTDEKGELIAHVASGIYFKRDEIERYMIQIAHPKAEGGVAKVSRGPRPDKRNRAIAAMIAKGKEWLYDPAATEESRTADLNADGLDISRSTVRNALGAAKSRFESGS
ncbi:MULTISPECIES: hypothetical protein [Hyphomicrobiales]|jgi:hypothetical protein|uniref:hypothetical protein n=1 Tax=Methylobacterium sp. CCH7-A2 TaxID=1768789 RepID=UPI00082FDE2E|nr:MULTISPECIES: hypothetical protein [Hyphomicrobiales]